MTTGKIKQAEIFEAPYISVRAKVVQPGTTNGKSNIKYKEEYVVAPSGKKIATYIRNQLFGSELITETEDLNINWLMPTLSEALEKAIYQTESFIYLHKYNNKVYLECVKKCDIHNLVQRYDKIISCDIIQDFDDGEDYDYSLNRHIELKDGKVINDIIANPIKVKNTAVQPKLSAIAPSPYELIVLPR
mgnify:CR=1 FL=1